MATGIIFSFIILIFSVILHEISHGYMALYLGDPTAKYQGRLTLNPLKHIDPVGSILVPIVTYALTGVTFGWAKPVPFNPYNLRNRRWGEALVAVAGPAANISIAVVFAVALRFMIAMPSLSASASLAGASIATSSFFIAAVSIIETIILINVALAIFNLIPVPPLDGSKILFAFFPQTQSWRTIRQNLERYQIVLLLLYVFLVWQFLAPLIGVAFTWLTGIPF
jgi:Zn-dependent protease